MEQAAACLEAERKVTAKLREKVSELEKNMAALKEGLEAEKVVASLAYFEEKSEELVAMGAELMKEGREVGWSQCKGKILAFFKAKFPDLDPSQIDLNIPPIEEENIGSLPAPLTHKGQSIEPKKDPGC